LSIVDWRIRVDLTRYSKRDNRRNCCRRAGANNVPFLTLWS
jgi:hypothetical protein